MPSRPTLLRPVTPAGSVLLDVVRFAAAIAVAFGHLTGAEFSTHWPYMLTLAVDAVAIFFVLSGFVIRLISKARHMTAASYAVDRFSRIYSVLLPALLFTVAVVACLHLFPSTRVPAPADSLRSLTLQFLACATFTGSLWGLDIPMSFNSVFWSLSYEWAYYSFYAIAFFAAVSGGSRSSPSPSSSDRLSSSCSRSGSSAAHSTTSTSGSVPHPAHSQNISDCSPPQPC